MRPPRSLGELLRQGVLLILGLVSLFPIYFAVVNSFKNPVQYAQNLLNVPPSLHPENYLVAWRAVASPMVNSLVVTFTSVLFTLLLAVLSAYAFALMRFVGRRVLFALVFALLLIPDFLTLIPLYIQIKSLDLPNNYLSIILPTIAAGQAFAILVLKTAFENLPKEILEAARIDGASHAQILARVVVPMSVPVLISVAIIRLIPVWNEFILPSLVLDEAHRTLPVALVYFQGGGNSNPSTPNYGALMASYVLSAVPLVVLFAFLMRSYIEGLTSGAVKA
ncbi:carbohydrate ABC transporter permease [Deinococcus yavapaiensis]|uniref:Carbohydrate ABC transporter membrane protein 2 (CUT1 family) n=1 Tax=Deinococcus yavapaiensis KR-236 TaxID=694435 RepID=A0A318S4K5_9DEIO|nr:carbohydrate ABC transporter permease [Deinococcus yavapaiensis]PYE51910.1 carbohydrate ABC transporter membrane protein 2 (CUT1 family) [Deinococcus yavapaiensis KR-236]